ncbi:PaaX family transcriptional regulator [Geodermatophilus sabuli]|uniref:PaaX family transcriptional regulator n=1 Tax=Geodermatophilus sabuli TaxID=1564158 RepID=A0A7K3VXL7_9ACTN|nr:PaaX family transcriptional regulator [Geodermatophilus sabuli]
MTAAESPPEARGAGAGLSAGSARSLLLTILGELVWPENRPVWTSALLYVLRGLEVEEQTARQAIARGAAAGWITGERHGREVQWSLTPSGRKLIKEGAARVTSTTAARTGWDGRWLILLVTIPHTHRTVRKRLYAGLTWAGFGNPTPGVWISPHPDRQEEAARLIAELDLQDNALSFIGPCGAIGLSDEEIVARAWDLATLSEHFEAQLAALADIDPEPGDPMLLTHIQVVSEWQRAPFKDPQLPEELLPNWVGHRAAARLGELRARWSDAVHARWREINTEDGTVG